MQNVLRVLILIALFITAYLLVLAWQKDYGNKPTTQVQTTVNSSSGDFSANATSSSGDFVVPTTNNSGDSTNDAVAGNKIIDVSTDMYDIKIDPKGGDIVYAALKKYDAHLDNKDPMVLLENNSNRVYIAQSELLNLSDTNANKERTNYQYSLDNFVMSDGQDTLSVPLTYTHNGITITKTYTFTKGKYPIEVSYNINNPTSQAWQGQVSLQLKRDDSVDPGMENKGPLSMATYLGGAWGTPDSDYNKLKFDEFNKDEINNIHSQEGWVGIVQHYFVSAWTPDNFSGQFFSRESAGNYLIGVNSKPISVSAGTQDTLTATLYAGPKVQSDLKDVAAGLNKTVDYGIFWPISKVMFAVLNWLHSIIGNWGWAIIGLTLLVKMALMWISGKSYHSMAKMRAIAPKLQALKEEHSDDRMAMSQAMMNIYKEEKVNPMAGCLPLLMQMPIFLGLYWVLVESVELRHAPWILWIKDLSAMDPLFILPIFMGVSMFVQQMLNPQPTDPTQAKVMKIMPIIFTAMMMFFPAGLVLYWTVNNLFSMAQQYYINKKVEKEYASREESIT